FEGKLNIELVNQMLTYQVICIVLIISSFIINSLYKREWRFASVGEVLLLIRAVTLTMTAATIIAVIFVKPRLPLSIAFTAYLTILLCIGSSRLAIRVFRDGYIKGK